MTDQRPNPDKLLKRVQDEERLEQRGKLKIYLGAAPGVGKTHEMLHDALEKISQGLDVVVGVAESHGRKEVDALLKDFEILPRQTMDYHGKKIEEFDLDGAFKRHPGLILIDEMAHTNVEGSRHKKRWQDIKELLDRGIDVYTTLNVQHIESLNDDVAQIVHAPINETVPDSMIEMADTIELVDIPPEDLLKRLHEGKIYIPEQASLAAESFFRKGNLIALRELALRTTAERVGAQVLLYRQGLGIKHVWPSKEKIMVCVGPGRESLKLIRAAKRLATALKTDWIAVYVDTPRIKLSEEVRNQAIKNLYFAEQLGAETRVLTGFDVVNEIMDFARDQNVTQIMIWKHIRNRWKNLLSRNLADEIVRHSGEIDVYIMTGSISEAEPEKLASSKEPVSWRSYGISLFIIAMATVLDFALYPYLSASNLIMVYLLGVTLVALSGNIGSSVFASCLSVLAYDYFFIPPFYSFAVSDFEYMFTLIVMLLVTYVISYLTVLTRRQAESARQIEQQTTALYTLSRQLSRTRGIDNLLNTGLSYIAEMFQCEVLALMPQNSHMAVRAKYRTNRELNEKEKGVARWVFDMGQKAGLGTDTLSNSEALYLPLQGAQGVIGVLRIFPDRPQHIVSPEQFHLLEACANQIALALEVDYLHEQSNKS